MSHSTLTRKGQTTIPIEIRRVLGLKTGDRISYQIEGKTVTLRPDGGMASLAGALASDRGRGKSFRQIRAAAARAWVRQARREGFGK